MKKLVKLLKEHGIGVAYDCCGKPIAELGLEVDEKRKRISLTMKEVK